MSTPKHLVLYCSDGTYTLVINNRKKDYEFSCLHKKLNYGTAQRMSQAIESGVDIQNLQQAIAS